MDLLCPWTLWECRTRVGRRQCGQRRECRQHEDPAAVSSWPGSSSMSVACSIEWTPERTAFFIPDDPWAWAATFRPAWCASSTAAWSSSTVICAWSGEVPGVRTPPDAMTLMTAAPAAICARTRLVLVGLLPPPDVDLAWRRSANRQTAATIRGPGNSSWALAVAMYDGNVARAHSRRGEADPSQGLCRAARSIWTMSDRASLWRTCDDIRSAPGPNVRTVDRPVNSVVLGIDRCRPVGGEVSIDPTTAIVVPRINRGQFDRTTVPSSALRIGNGRSSGRS